MLAPRRGAEDHRDGMRLTTCFLDLLALTRSIGEERVVVGTEEAHEKRRSMIKTGRAREEAIFLHWTLCSTGRLCTVFQRGVSFLILDPSSAILAWLRPRAASQKNGEYWRRQGEERR